MADVKISELTAASALDGTEKIPLVQSSTTVRSTIAAILTYIQAQALNLSANFAIATSKFTVNATSGNTAAAGTVTAKGLISLEDQSIDALVLGRYSAGSQKAIVKASANAVDGIEFQSRDNAIATLAIAENGDVDITGAVSAASASITGAVAAGSASFTAALPVASGGTGATSLNGAGIVEKSGDQTIAGTKTFSTPIAVGSGGTGASTLDAAGIVQKTGAQTIGGVKTFSDPPVFSQHIQAGGVGLADPTLTTRSVGTRAIFYDALSGSSVDYALGMNSFGPWVSLTAATDRFQVFRNTDSVWNVRGDGLQTNTGGHVEKVRVATTTPDSPNASTDYIIIVKMASASAVAVSLPASPATGLTYVIKDGTGDANSNNITITPAAGTIDGAGTLVIADAYGRVKITYNGTEWNRID